MTSEGEMLAELERCGWNNPTEAVVAHWPGAVQANFDWSQGILRWPIRAPKMAFPNVSEPPKAIPFLCIEYWLETGRWEGKPAYRILGKIPGISASQIEVQEPKWK